MFEFLRLAHPPLGPQPARAARLSMRVPVTDRVGLPLPITAYDLPWASVDVHRAAVVADALDELGVAVAALRCELGDGTDDSELNFIPEPNPNPNPNPNLTLDLKRPSCRISNRFCPYRPDRYGLNLDDLTTAKIVDIRLASRRHADGRFVHSADQLRRWDVRPNRKPGQEPVHDSAMPAALWPPDVRSLDKLAGKVAELRQLAPAAAICVSVAPDTLEAGLPMAVHAGIDMLALRADDWSPADGPQLAARIARTRRWLDANQGSAIRMLVVPPPSIGAADGVKLLALGADLVAVDGWCSDLLERGPSAAAEEWAVATLGVSTRPTTDVAPEVDTAALHRCIEQIAALVESTGVASVTELGPKHLASTGPTIPGVRTV